MVSFRSVLVACATALLIGWFVLDFFRGYTRYDFLVKGDVCIALDRQADALKVVNMDGCIVIPLTKTPEQEMQEKVEREMREKLRGRRSRAEEATEVATNNIQAVRPPSVAPNELEPTFAAG